MNKKMVMTSEELHYSKQFLTSLLIQVKNGNKKFEDVKAECKKIVMSYNVHITKRKASNVIHIENCLTCN